LPPCHCIPSARRSALGEVAIDILPSPSIALRCDTGTQNSPLTVAPPVNRSGGDGGGGGTSGIRLIFAVLQPPMPFKSFRAATSLPLRNNDDDGMQPVPQHSCGPGSARGLGGDIETEIAEIRVEAEQKTGWLFIGGKKNTRKRQRYFTRGLATIDARPLVMSIHDGKAVSPGQAFC
jgi:hypothetical protein